MSRNFKFITLALSFMFCLSAIAFGQGTTGSIEGYVSDAQGARIPNATVKVESTGTTAGFNRTVTADGEGYINIQRVPPGTYRVTVSAANFSDKSTDVTVVLDKASNIETILDVAGSSPNTVDVIANSDVSIDTTNTKIDTNITKQIIDDLPKGTQFTSLLKIAPNVRPEPLAAGFQIDGASGAENVFVVDGQEVTNFRTGQLNANNNLPFELLQEVQVKSTGFEAEYGGATGGVINVVTTGGNNSLRGNFGVSFRPARLQGDPNLILNRYDLPAGSVEYFNPVKYGGTDFFPVASLTGPIVKDKFWFSAIYAPQLFNTTQDVPFYTDGTFDPVTGLQIPSQNPNVRRVGANQRFNYNRKIEEAFVRLDAQPTSNLRMFGSFLYNPIIDQGALVSGALGLTSTTSVGPLRSQNNAVIAQNQFRDNQGGRQNSNNINGQVTWTPTNSLVFNFRAGRSFLNEKLGSYGIPRETQYTCSTSSTFTTQITPASAGCTRGFTNFPSNFQIAYDVSTRTTFDADASIVGINLGGRHNFKFGYQYNRLFNTTDQGYAGEGIVTVFYGLTLAQSIGLPGSGQPLCTAANTGNPNCIVGSAILQRFATKGEASSANQGFFAQDSWQIGNRLTFNVGIRAEKEKVPSFSDAGSDIEFNFGDKIAPRFGVAFDLLGDGKTKLFASYGWFYDRFKYELPRGSFGGDFFRRDYFELTAARGYNYANYTTARILGTVPDMPGGNCPTGSAPLGNGYSVCQDDFRIPSNLIGGSIFESGGVDPDLKAARQSEYTIGLERELFTNFLLGARYTHKQLDHVIEDVGLFNSQGSEAYIIGNPGEGLVCDIASGANRPCTKAQRDYDAFEIRLDKRASKYFFNASYTYSRLFGNYSGLASSDEAGRSSPNVNRFFDLPFLGYTAAGDPDNGRLATDRPHVFKAFAGYNFNWFGNNNNVTTVSGFTTAQSGTPLTTVYQLYSITSAILFGRGDLGRTEMFTETDFNVSHRYKFGRDNRYTLEPFVNFRNLFDERNVLGTQTTISSANLRAAQLTNQGGCPVAICGTEGSIIDAILTGGGIQQYVVNYVNNPATALGNRTRNDYNLPNSFQAPREVRFGARFYF